MRDWRLTSFEFTGQPGAFIPLGRLASRCWDAIRGGSALIACAVALCFWVGQFAGGAQKTENIVRADTIKAQKYELVGADGTRSASLHGTAIGAPMLAMFDAKGARRLEVGVYERDQPGLRLFDAGAHNRLSLISGDKEVSMAMMVGSPLNESRIMLLALETGPLILISRDNRGQMSLELDSDAQPRMRLTSKDGKGGIFFSAELSGPVIGLVDSSSRLRTQMTLRPDESPQFGLIDEHGTTRLSIRIDNAGNPSIQQRER